MLTWNNPIDSYFSFHLSAHRNSEDAICSPSRSCSDEGLKCTEGVKQRKINIKKLMGILTLALRIDNPSNGFEITFLENYDPPIQFDTQCCELAHSTMVLLCFLVPSCVERDCRIYNSPEPWSLDFLKEIIDFLKE